MNLTNLYLGRVEERTEISEHPIYNLSKVKVKSSDLNKVLKRAKGYKFIRQNGDGIYFACNSGFENLPLVKEL